MKQVMAVLLILMLIGCSTKPVSSPPVKTQTERASRIRTLLDTWGREPSNPDFPEWVGVDESGRVVVVGNNNGGGDIGQYMEWATKWFQQANVDIIAFSTRLWSSSEPRQRAEITKLTREKFQAWPAHSAGKLPFSPAEWAKHVDFHAERREYLPSTEEQVNSLVKTWITKQAGDRLIQLSQQNGPVTVTMQPGNLSDQERLSEAMRFALLSSYTSGPFLRVEYQGASTTRVIEIRNEGPREWAKAGGDPVHIAGHMEIDGFQDYKKENKAYKPQPPLTQEGLATLLSKRTEWQAWLPKDANLIIGESRVGGEGTIAIEAEVPMSQSWDAAYLQYHDSVVKLFASTPLLKIINITLRRGREVVAMEHWYKWEVWKHIAAAGGKPDPVLFPLAANWYDRFTLVTPSEGGAR